MDEPAWRITIKYGPNDHAGKKYNRQNGFNDTLHSRFRVIQYSMYMYRQCFQGPIFNYRRMVMSRRILPTTVYGESLTLNDPRQLQM